MDSIYDFEVSKEDEQALRNYWKLPATCQFINMFKSFFKLKEVVTPYDLEQSLLRPQHDPLCGEIMSKLLVKKQIKKDGTIIMHENPTHLSDYKTWNEVLGKKFALMYKNYRKFCIKHLGEDPFLATGQSQVEEDKVPKSEPEAEDLNKQSTVAIDKIEEIKQQDTVVVTNDDSKENKRKTRKTNLDSQLSINTFEPRTTRRSKAQEQQKEKQNQKQINTKVQKKAQSPPKPPKYEPLWTSDVKENLLKCEEANFITKFAHDYQNLWTCESLQIVRLFSQELDNQDPFYIQGQEEMKDGNGQGGPQSNYYNNFMDTEQLDEYDETQMFGLSKIEIEFKKFHEILVKQRLDILYFLCQNKLDSENMEFQTEILPLTQQKPTKLEPIDGQPPKFSDELRVMQEPVVIANLKPLGELNKDVGEYKIGKYYYFAQFQDTRIYIQNSNQHFELLTEDIEVIQSFIQLLSEQPEYREDCHQLKDEMNKYQEFYKRFGEEMKRKEASKIRKLQSQIRSRKIMDRNRQKLQFEGKQNQLQTDYLHHTQGKVMTRTQINTIKEKMTKGGPEGSRRGTRGQSAAAQQKDLQKEKYEKEKLERQKRLEKRMQIKENGGRAGGKRKRGQDSEDYGYESYGDEQYPMKKVKLDQGGNPEDDVGANDEQTIIMQGSLLLIYQRKPDNENEITELTMVLKGRWRLSNDEFLQDLIYKKVADPQEENLLREYLCEDRNQWLQIPNDIGDVMQINNHFQMMQRLYSCQGLFEGYFVYNEQDIQEKFNMILGRSTKGHDREFPLFCYGENNIGPFVMQGSLNIIPTNKLKEKDGKKGFKKVKFGKFTLQRQYRTKILEELVEDLRVERRGQRNDISINLGNSHHVTQAPQPVPSKPYFSITKVPPHSMDQVNQGQNHYTQKLPPFQNVLGSQSQNTNQIKHPFQIERMQPPHTQVMNQQFQPIQLPTISFQSIMQQPNEYQNPLPQFGIQNYANKSHSQESTNIDQKIFFPNQSNPVQPPPQFQQVPPIQVAPPQQQNIFMPSNDYQQEISANNMQQFDLSTQLPPISQFINQGNVQMPQQDNKNNQQQSNGQQ